MAPKCDCADGANPVQDGNTGCCEPKPATGSGKRDAETACCAPGSDCCGPGGGMKAMKTVICVGTLVVIIGILAYKATVAGGDKSEAVTSTNARGFSFTPAGQRSQAADDSRSADSVKAGTFGVALNSLGDLDEAAKEQDAVFVFIPGSEDDLAGGETIAAALAAQKALGRNKVALGLYTLPRESSDYAEIAEQIEVPAVLVARKGGGMNAVMGKVTEQKLLQAFVAAASDGCCPSAASSCCP